MEITAATAVNPKQETRAWLSRPMILAPWCMIAAFGAYACMYGFRKPFTAASYMGAEWGAGFKAWLVTSQVLGYTVSKFIGIRIIAEMKPERRAGLILMLVGIAQVALVLFGIVPPPYSAACLFLNGLPLGMVFGLVLGFLEGRRMTEAFVAGLCASFILADGFTKSVGAVLLQSGVSERWMPALAGLIFLVPLAGFVWMLLLIPAPNKEDVAARSARKPMTKEDRRGVLRRHGLGLALLALAFLLVTILRSVRADFAPEIWAALGRKDQPSVFTTSEIWVAFGVLALNGSICLVKNNRLAFQLSLFSCMAGLGLSALCLLGLKSGRLSPFVFMTLFGLGMYVAYVAFHTTIFERFIAATRERANVGYLMYLSDATGYLGYVAVMLGKSYWQPNMAFLSFFSTLSWIALGLALMAFIGAALFFSTRLKEK
jgi:hypothetical protein